MAKKPKSPKTTKTTKEPAVSAVPAVASAQASEFKANTKIIYDGPAFNDLIDHIEAVSKSYVSDVDKALRAAALHHIVHGNVTPLNRIFLATKTTTHKNSVAVWIRKHTAAVWNNETSAFEHSKVKVAAAHADMAATVTSIENAPAYFDLAKPDDPFKGFDLVAELKKLVARTREMDRAAQEGTLKKKGAVVELSDEDISKIDIDHALLSTLAALSTKGTSAKVLLN